jgi:hypothetical protein
VSPGWGGGGGGAAAAAEAQSFVNPLRGAMASPADDMEWK